MSGYTQVGVVGLRNSDGGIQRTLPIFVRNDDADNGAGGRLDGEETAINRIASMYAYKLKERQERDVGGE